MIDKNRSARGYHRSFLSSASTSSTSLSTHLHPSRSLYQVWFNGEAIWETRSASATGDLVDRSFRRKRWDFITALEIFGKGFQLFLSLARDSWPLLKSVKLAIRGFRPTVLSSLAESPIESATTPVAVSGRFLMRSVNVGSECDRGAGCGVKAQLKVECLGCGLWGAETGSGPVGQRGVFTTHNQCTPTIFI